jgi:hypothetical protein
VTASASQQIDTLLAADWAKHNLKPNPPASDEVFVRRVYLDVIGRIPTYREATDFLSAKDAQKRAKLIDTLLASEGYAQNFFPYWADILRAQTEAPGGAVTSTAYLNYIKESLRTNKPYDQFVRGMIGAQGRAWDAGGIGYYMRDRGMPLDSFATTARIFLGTRIECAQCHNHPFDKWTPMQFYQMTAFSYGVNTSDALGGVLAQAQKLDRKRGLQAYANRKTRGVDYKENLALIQESERSYDYALSFVRGPLSFSLVNFTDRKLLLPHDYQYSDAKPKTPVPAATMMGKPVTAAPGENCLQEYAQWMTSPDNPRFTTVVANRLWKKLFGLGLIEPVDEMKDETVAMNPELMAHLEKLMVSVGYDLKAYLRVLLNTQTYQRAVSREEVAMGASYHFTGPLLRRMTAEQMWDSFVALISPAPDAPNTLARERAEDQVIQAKKITDALETLTPEEALEAIDKIAQVGRDLKERAKEVVAQVAAAEVAGDKAKAKELSSTLNLKRTHVPMRQAANDFLYAPALRRLAEQHGAKPAPPTAPGANGSGPNATGEVMAAEGKFAAIENIRVPGYDRPQKTADEERADTEREEQSWREEAATHGVPEKDHTKFVEFRRSVAREWVRAAELPSPAPRGHYLREFGQSDRETTENANLDASVPQALALMNSALLPRVLDRFSQLMLSLRDASTPDAQADAIYLTLLSRQPTTHEREAWQAAQQTGLTSAEDLIYALLNTRQFIFIQ